MEPSQVNYFEIQVLQQQGTFQIRSRLGRKTRIVLLKAYLERKTAY